MLERGTEIIINRDIELKNVKIPKGTTGTIAHKEKAFDAYTITLNMTEIIPPPASHVVLVLDVDFNLGSSALASDLSSLFSNKTALNLLLDKNLYLVSGGTIVLNGVIDLIQLKRLSGANVDIFLKDINIKYNDFIKECIVDVEENINLYTITKNERNPTN